VLAFRIAIERKEVIPGKDHVDAGLLGGIHCTSQVCVIGVLRL
jgi:hypothetical protein